MALKKKKKEIQQTNQTNKSDTILFFHVVPVKYFEAAMKQS